MLLLGHRGARKFAPDNTIAAFELALEHGCDGIEFDVRLTADRQAVICHDAEYCGRPVAFSSYSALAEADPVHPILRLEDVAARFGSRSFLYIELKTGGLEEIVLRTVRDHIPTRGCVVASFLPEVVRQLHEQSSRAGIAAPIGLICGNRGQLARWREMPVEYVMPRSRMVSTSLVSELHRWGKRVLTWTVNSEREMRHIAECGVDGLLSDDTRLLTRTLGGLQRPRIESAGSTV